VWDLLSGGLSIVTKRRSARDCGLGPEGARSSGLAQQRDGNTKITEETQDSALY
jgi:hypothetical protein